MDWFLYDNAIRHERVKCKIRLILLASPVQLLKCQKVILEEIFLTVKNLKLYQHFAILEMLMDSLEEVLVLSLLVFALLRRLSMNLANIKKSRYIFCQQRKFFYHLLLGVYSCMEARRATAKRGSVLYNKKWLCHDLLGVKLSQRQPTDDLM